MITLYVKTGCPYCLGVLGKVNELGIDIEEKNISDEANLNELLEIGGKKQVPFMVDSTRNVSMYESGDIVDYLNEHYAKSSEEGEPSSEE